MVKIPLICNDVEYTRTNKLLTPDPTTMRTKIFTRGVLVYLKELKEQDCDGLIQETIS